MEAELSTFAIPMVIGNGGSGGIGIGLEELIGGSAIRTGLIRGAGIAAVGYLIINLFSSPPNPALYTGEGVMVLALPYEANLLEVPQTIDVPVAIPHQLPNSKDKCDTYVIFRIMTDGSVQVAKYGITCQEDYDDNTNCNPRPDKQVIVFDSEKDPQVVKYYNWIIRDVSKTVALMVEKSMTAIYVINKLGQLPPKHDLPCFIKGSLTVWNKRADLARKYLDEMIKQYGK